MRGKRPGRSRFPSRHRDHRCHQEFCRLPLVRMGFEYLTKMVPSHAGSVSQEEVSHESESGEKESENREDGLEVVFDWSVPGRPNTNKVLMLLLSLTSSAMAGSPPSTTGPIFVPSRHHQSWRRGGPAILLYEDINPLRVPSGPGWLLCRIHQSSHRQDEQVWLALCFVRDLRVGLLWL